MLLIYFEIDKLIFENKQNGKDRVEYAEERLKNLSKQLTKEFRRDR